VLVGYEVEDSICLNPAAVSVRNQSRCIGRSRSDNALSRPERDGSIGQGNVLLRRLLL
jgi:hypothetical protein